MKKSFLNFAFTLMFLLSFTLGCSQNAKKENKPVEITNPERGKLIGKTFKGTVGSRCVATKPPNPCAGYMYYLILEFKKNEVKVTEGTVSNCGKKVDKKSFLTSWNIKNNAVTVDKMIRYGQPLAIKTLTLNYNELTGSEVDFNGNTTEYIFTEI